MDEINTKKFKSLIPITNLMPKFKSLKGHAEKKNVIPFANTFADISPQMLEEIMEWLNDHKYLSETGKVFRHRFWFLFIKK